MQYNTQQLTEIRIQIFKRYVYCCQVKLFQKAAGKGNLDFWDMQEIKLGRYPESKLQLLPLSSITDEHKILVAELMRETEDLLYWGSYWISKHKNGDNMLGWRQLGIYQLLQIFGYATEQTVLLDGKPVTLSVDQQVELGVIELK